MKNNQTYNWDFAGMSYFARGKPPSYRGRGGRGQNDILIRQGNRTLVPRQNNDPLFQEFLEYKKEKGKTEMSYAKVVGEDSNENHDSGYTTNQEEKLILMLKDSDLKWQDHPYLLLERYTLHHNYTAGSYKTQSYWENLLMNCGSCEISHFSGIQKEIYNFSKIIIKKIISPEEWGLSPFKEKSFVFPNNNTPIKYNYWDYLEAFDKVLLYENDKLKHTWMIKVCSKVYNFELPNWFIIWWQFHGASDNILPDKIKLYFEKWKKTSPKNKLFTEDEEKVKSFMFFMIEFSIPYIWRWKPYVQIEDGIFPRLTRHSQAKFWEKMIRPDPNTGVIPGEDTFQLIEKRLEEFDQYQINKQKEKEEEESFSRQELIEIYLAQMEKQLIDLDGENVSSNTSMADSQDNTFKILGDFEDSQNPNEESDLKFIDLFEQFKDDFNALKKSRGKKPVGECSKTTNEEK